MILIELVQADDFGKVFSEETSRVVVVRDGHKETHPKSIGRMRRTKIHPGARHTGGRANFLEMVHLRARRADANHLLDLATQVPPPFHLVNGSSLFARAGRVSSRIRSFHKRTCFETQLKSIRSRV